MANDDLPARRNALVEALLGARNAIPENTEHSLSLANMLRGGLGSAAGWMDWQNRLSPDDYSPQEVLSPPGMAFGLRGANTAEHLAPSSAKASADFGAARYYHGTDKEFAKPGGTFFITDNPRAASMFADESYRGTQGGRVIPLQIKTEGLADLTSPEHLERIAQALVEVTPWQRGKPLSIQEARKQVADVGNIENGRASWASEPIINAAQRAGFSGVPVRESWAPFGHPDSHSIAMFPANAPGHMRNALSGELYAGNARAALPGLALPGRSTDGEPQQ